VSSKSRKMWTDRWKTDLEKIEEHELSPTNGSLMIHMLPMASQTAGGIELTEAQRVPTNWGILLAAAPDAASDTVDWRDYEGCFVAIQDNEGVPHRLTPALDSPVVVVAHYTAVIDMKPLEEAVKLGMFPEADDS
jgi:hypothetical protein